MSDENSQPGPLAALERTLAGFRPAAPQIDRDRLLFLAGQASAREATPLPAIRTADSSRSHCLRWLWPASTAALALTSLALATALVRQPEPRTDVVVRHVPAPAPETIAPAATAAAPTSAISRQPELASTRIPAENYLRTREVALRMGLDAIGFRPAHTNQPVALSHADLLLDLTGTKPAADGDKPPTNLPVNM